MFFFFSPTGRPERLLPRPSRRPLRHCLLLSPPEIGGSAGGSLRPDFPGFQHIGLYSDIDTTKGSSVHQIWSTRSLAITQNKSFARRSPTAPVFYFSFSIISRPTQGFSTVNWRNSEKEKIPTSINTDNIDINL